MKISALAPFLCCLLFSLKVSGQVSCNNWLRIPNSQSYVTVGEIDIPGTQITVEGLFSRDSAFTPEGFTSLNIVSKHWTPADVNYLLRVDRAQVTTTNGHFMTPEICELKNKKIYHVAMTYDGTTLKFYQNGSLMSQIPCTGDMFQNDYLTTIAATANSPTTNTQLIGYLNEIRIWNVVKTQAELQQYMESPLPNPATAPGLLGYYTFESLSNKQGNSLFNATLHGDAAINQTIPDCNFVADSCSSIITSACNNWLRIPNYNTQDYIAIGDLDVTGNTITVEAQFAADTNYFIPSTISYDLVSKHTGTSDCNYLLRPVTAEITTTNGFFQIIACDYKPKKINHAALVYDGSTLKFYRNGFLMGSKPATGNLVTNDLITKIGNYSFGSVNGSLKGYMNEVRIWNIARTQDEIKAYMNTPLPNPTTLAGLVAYYQFDDLTNKQGNTTWNGTLNGAATINNTVPNCSFYADSCITATSITGISGIINYYTPVTSFNPCDNNISVEDASGFRVGDTVLMIQMKGAVIDSTNTSNFGTVTDYKNAGNYEFNYVKAITGNTVELKNVLLRQYDIPSGRVQMIRVPFYKSVTITDTLTCLPWDGRKGGVLVLNVLDTVTLQKDIDVSGRGFKGGKGINSGETNWQPTCQASNYFYPSTAFASQGKGEGISELSNTKMSGKGSLANGGGGGNTVNSGGGGGSNIVAGGIGGDQFEGCSSTSPGALPGKALTYSSSINRLFLGGGGGAGDANDPFGASAFNPDGGNGGGIVILSADAIQADGHKITSNGYNGKVCNTNCNEGVGGGGAAGVVFASINSYISPLTISVQGGKGANNTAWFNGSYFTHGPGGGGGGGAILLKQVSLPANIIVQNNGGANGVSINNGNLNWNAQPGNTGLTQFNYTLPVSTQVFKPNIDSVRIKDTLTSCRTFSFTGIGYTNTNPIQNWNWNFGDNNTASSQNTTHTYATTGNFDVKLVVTDINGCTDSIVKTITVTTCPDTFINSYAAVLNIDFCTNSITADDISSFNTGDTVVIMQMKGASVDSSNTIDFGSITNINNAGKYEFNYVKSKTGNTIIFQNTFLNKYDAARGRVQLIRVPYFSSLTVNNTLTCPEWSGVKGGVLIINSATDVNLNATIDVSNKGFNGGAVGAGFSCGNTDLWAVAAPAGGVKGEGIAEYITGFDAGGGRMASGGGGAYAANSGGGGGGNYGSGGLGGSHSNTCPVTTQSMQGQAADYTSGDRVFAGGGGGGGQQDDSQPVAAGGRGGGIVIIKAFTLNSNNQGIVANGESVSTLVRDEGGAGGGAGGSVLLFVNGYSGNLFIEANGGEGSSNDNIIYPSRCHGPGGGGGGGFVGSSLAVLPPFITTNFIGGRAGFIMNPASACFNTTYNATDGTAGGSLFNLRIPEATIPFIKNIDSVRIKDSLIACTSFDFKGTAYINSAPVQKWEWSFGDGGTDTLQNTTHTYAGYGSNTVKLVITDLNGCKDSITKTVQTNGINFDFVFEQDVCDPLNIRFRAVGDTTAEIFWSTGDGAIITDNRNPTHIYPSIGSYLVKYSTGNATTGCIDTVVKTIFIGSIYNNIILTPDTTICFGSSKQLRSNIDSTLEFCWQPVNFLSNPAFASPVTNTPATITYFLQAMDQQGNVITNGDFSNGNTDFTSGLNLSASPLSPGSYEITTSSSTAGPGTFNCSDHSTGSGNMLVARADFNTTAAVWKQTVTVLPHTNYSFSAWTQSLITPNTSLLQLSINGNVVVDTITLLNPTCNWTKHSVLWNSGENTTADLAIVHQSPAPATGGYFAVDDIEMSVYSIKRDSVKITVDTPYVDTRTDTAVCESVPVTLLTTGAAVYNWTPAAGLSSSTAESPVATPADTTKYIVTGTNVFGCTASDSVTVFVKPKPVITNTGDTSICTGSSAPLFATGGISYAWTPAALLDNPNIANPVANPSAVNTTYAVTVTGANSCITRDSFLVAVNPIPVFSVSGDKAVCLNTNTQLSASGGNYYEWSPAALVSNPAISNPTVVTTDNTLYTVLIKDTTCGYDTTLTTAITILPQPVITAAKENDINCATGSTRLLATGAVQYNWTPASTLNNATSSSPLASPVNSTTYTVTGTNVEGCTNTATVTVFADYSNKPTFLLPNAFSPNGDGNNDCFRLKYFGLVTELQLTIFSRWGEKVFYTSNANDCWDGTYKGNPCETGNFVYYIKAKTTCGNVEKKGNLILVR